jgi:hypothetical protein
MTKTGWLIAGALAAAVAEFLVLQLTVFSSGRSTDPEVLQRIEDANCGQLRDIADNSVLDLGPGASDEETLQAIEYEQAAEDRMKELDCFGG